MMRQVAVIILAAGASRRLGQPKQLLSFRRKSLLRHAVETALRTNLRPVVVVIGSEAERMRQELSGLDAQVVENQEWREGAASSIRAGLKEVGEVAGVVIMLCDQPFVPAEFLERLGNSERLAAAEYGGSVGVPAFFAREFFDELNELKGDQGAKKILIEHDATRIPCPEAAVDIDTPESISKLL
jgi:molybdenum cofactor cytidylyltransferase